MHWNAQPVHFIDFEGSVGSGILEFGVVTLLGGEIVATRTRLCQAVGRIRRADSAVHQLTDRAVAAEAPFAEEFEYFAQLRERGPLAAHFAGTENGLLKSVWPYARLSRDFSHPTAHTAEWGPWVDTGRLWSELHPKAESLELEALVETLGIKERLVELAVAHCPANRRFYHAALFDALAGALVLRELLNRPEFAAATLPWLLQLSIGDKRKRADMQQDTLF